MLSRRSKTRNHLCIALACLSISGCSQAKYRIDADREAYEVIAERNQDDRWANNNVSIDADPKSRFFDNYDPDHSPMPVDDPSSNQYMKEVDNIPGWKHWTDHGVREYLENPQWREQLASYTKVTEEGACELSLDSAIKLAYLHSPSHQRSLETVYLSSLDVTGQRFRLDTQFFGGTGTSYVHRGDISPTAIAFSPSSGGYVVEGPFDTPERNRFAITSPASASRRLATAGEVLIGFANSFTWDFTGSDASLGSSLANFSFVQPLLRGAGKDIALEQLTQSERTLLSNLRSYAQFRQGFFTQVAIGELGVSTPQRSGASTTLQSFSGVGGVGGYLGLLQQAQQIRNTEDLLRRQLQTLDRLEAFLRNELIDIVQVDLFRQEIEDARANLLDQTNRFELSVDNYKTQILGLPADLLATIDETAIEGFQLIPIEANPIVEALLETQRRIGEAGMLLDLRQRAEDLETELLSPDPTEQSAFELASMRVQSLNQAIMGRLDQLPNDLLLVESMLNEAVGPISKLTNQEIKSLILAYDDDIDTIIERFQSNANRIDAMLTSALANPSGKQDETGAVIEGNFQRDPELLLQVVSECKDILILQLIATDNNAEPQKTLEIAESLLVPVRGLKKLAERDIQRMEEMAPERERSMDATKIQRFREDRQRITSRLAELEFGENGLEESQQALKKIREASTEENREQTISELIAWTQSYTQFVDRLMLIPAQARIEVISVESIDLSPDQALEIALDNRLDFMNGRAAFVDQWRSIQIAADALQSNVSITGNWDLKTARNNPLDFRGDTSNLRLGFEFDAPLTRLLERNGYRESLIQFQRSRRALIQSHDGLQKGLRSLLRTLEQRRLQLEIQRRAVFIALRRVEQTQLSLLTPPPPVQPGARPQINPTTAINLLGAQRSLQSSQNSFLAAWLNEYAARLRLYRELGIMKLDAEGKWVEDPIDTEAYTARLTDFDDSAIEADLIDPNPNSRNAITSAARQPSIREQNATSALAKPPRPPSPKSLEGGPTATLKRRSSGFKLRQTIKNFTEPTTRVSERTSITPRVVESSVRR